jgi:outer membrane protein TolC
MNKKEILRVLLVLFFSSQLYANDILEKVGTYEYDLNNSLSLKQVINNVLENSLKAKSVLYQIPQKDSDKLKYNTQFSPYVALQHQQYILNNKEPKLAAFIENNTGFSQHTLVTGKKFETETELGFGVSKSDIYGLKSNYASTANDPMTFFSIKQSLLKNGFGINNSNTKKILDNQCISQKNNSLNQVALVVSEAIVSYWDVVERYRLYKNEELKEQAYLKIRKVLKSNVNIGLVEEDSLHQYNALILSSSSKKEINRNAYEESLAKLAILINKPLQDPNNMKLAGLDEVIATFNFKEYLEKAFKNRADHKNILLAINSLKLKRKIIKNESLPDMTLKYQLTNIPDGGGMLNPGSLLHNMEFGVSYLLDNKKNEIETRDGNYQLAQLELQKMQLQQEIEYEIKNIIGKIDVFYSSYQKAREARKEASIYFNLLIKKLKQGRLNSVQLTDAVDMMINVRKFETTMLLSYNKLLLQLKLATNTLFESYNIDINTYLEAIILEEK